MKNKYLLSCLCGAFIAMSAPASASLLVSSALSFDRGAGSYQTVSANSTQTSAEGMVADLADHAIGFLADSSKSSAARKSEFRKLLNKRFDMKTIARFALGKYWRGANDAQRAEYMKLFNTMIVDVYSQRFSDYSGQQIKVTGSRMESKSDVLVHSVMTQETGPDVKVDWRVRNNKVIDVIVAGVSMGLTQRSDFSSVIQRGGGNIEALLKHLR